MGADVVGRDDAVDVAAAATAGKYRKEVCSKTHRPGGRRGAGRRAVGWVQD